MHPNTLQGADHLAKVSGYRVVIPDFFRGASWPVDNMPPKEGREFLSAWIQERGTWEKIRPSLLATVERLKADGATSLGVGSSVSSFRSSFGTSLLRYRYTRC